MTEVQKSLIKKLLTGMYLRKSTNVSGDTVYKLYTGNQMPVSYYPEKVVEHFSHLLKRDNKGRITIHLSKVRQLHGKSFIKRAYKHVTNKTSSYAT